MAMTSPNNIEIPRILIPISGKNPVEVKHVLRKMCPEEDGKGGNKEEDSSKEEVSLVEYPMVA